MNRIQMIWRMVLVCTLAFIMLVNTMPLAVFAVTDDVTCDTINVVSDIELPDSDELFNHYLGSLFYPDNMPCFMGSAAGERLDADTKALYDLLVPLIKNIAQGDRTSTQIGFGQPLTYQGVSYPVDGALTFTWKSVDTGALLDALLLDLPYEMYWNDKVTGCKFKYFSRGTEVIHVTALFEVADSFQGSTDYSVDTLKAQTAANSVANANTIVTDNKSKTDYEKLVAYRDAICDLVSYDTDAAQSGNFSLDNNPWQLINVFDGNDNTNVVCEGYSKAFQYLCDLSTFSGDVTCYSIPGTMQYGGQSGGHMWNIVTLERNNYLVDVTNSDSRTVGSDGSLFLAGASKGTADTYYVVGSVTFFYDEDMKTLWGTDASSILTLATSNYEPKTTCSVTFNLEDMTFDGAVSVEIGSDYSAVLKANDGFILPDTISVMVGQTAISDFDYDSTTGLLTIPADVVNGNIVISACAACTHSQYVGGFCIYCGEAQPVPVLTLNYPTLSFEGEVFYNVYFDVSGAEVAVEDMGLLTWYTKPASLAEATVENAEENIPGAVYNSSNGVYMVRTKGIPAKQLGDNLYLRVYAKLSDGSYEYSSVTYYNAKYYANDILTNSSNTKMKALCVAMLNYGAAAQIHFNHNTASLMNADLTEEQQALVEAYSEDMIGDVVKADSNKTGVFKSNGGFSGGYPSVSFEGAFAINYYLTPKYTVADNMTLYCWDLETYNSVSELTKENAVAAVEMGKAANDVQYVGSYIGIAAKQIGETVFVAAEYESGGITYYSPVITYSIGAYCKDQIANGSDTMKAFSQATAVYGNYSAIYFAG